MWPGAAMIRRVLAPAVTACALVAVIVWFALAFNRLVRDRNRVAQAWSDVDVQLTRRHDLIPRLVEVVKGYAGYERALLENLAQLRERGSSLSSPAARGPLETSLGDGLRELIVRAEAYPDLKASESFLDLQRRLADAENQIQFARRYYNGAVNLFNTHQQSFPDLIVARACRFRPAEPFELETPQAAQRPVVTFTS